MNDPQAPAIPLSPIPGSAMHAFEARARRNIGRVMFAARWLMAPIYLGLLVVLALLAVKFVQQLVTIVPLVLDMQNDDIILATLTLVDLSLVANLLMIVIFSGWATFVGPLLHDPGERDMVWASDLDFSAVKLKLIGSIASIAVVGMLESFMHIDDVEKQSAAWQLAILLGVGVTGVLLALMDRLGGGHE